MIDRRDVLKGAVATLTTAIFTGRVRGANDRVAVAHIGVGAMGSSINPLWTRPSPPPGRRGKR
jgi:hypothetical protein